jgi:succinoglycan biosynthesis protein ExoA
MRKTHPFNLSGNVLMDVSVAITTYSEGDYLDRLLKDLADQKCGLNFEIILVEAGNYNIDRAHACLGSLSDKLIFINKPKLSRTEALNLIFQLAKGNLIVRLDARSHVDPNYLEDIFSLAKETGAENVGGVMAPIALDEKQAMIAEIMKSPFSFGGGKSRNSKHCGYADSVYLGAFQKDRCIYGEEWFDSRHPKISEDSDLNYRIKKNGGKIFIDSSIVVEHYPRESLARFFKLCFNYGVGRGLFIIKHRIVSGYRQLVPPISLITTLSLLVFGIFYPPSMYLLMGLLIIYFMIISLVAVSISKNIRQLPMAVMGFLGCHVFWTTGLLISPYVYRQDHKRKN